MLCRSFRTRRAAARCRRRTTNRRGGVVVLAAALMVMLFAFTSFTVDVGYIALARTQLQRTADASALAAALELGGALGMGAPRSTAEVEAAARQAAVDVAGEHRAAGRSTVYVDSQRDIRFGQVVWDPTTGDWQKTWGVPPYNMVEVTVRRDQSSGSADGPLALFFGPMIGHQYADVTVDATAALLPGAGFRSRPGSNQKADVLPFAMDEYTWNRMLAGETGEDKFGYDPDSEEVTTGSDGLLEVNLYPDGSDKPPGNRGTLDLGSSSNSTSDLERQILEGLNADDLSHFGGEIRTDNGPFDANGDTGISNGLKDEVTVVAGEPRAIPLFSSVTNPGNGANYTIVKFVGVRVVDVKMTGKNKRIYIQPGPVVDSTVTIDRTSGSLNPVSSIFTTPRLIR